MKYDDLGKQWLKDNATPMPFVNSIPEYPAYSADPEMINAYVWALDRGNPHEMYTKPDTMPYDMNYQTWMVNAGDAALFPKGQPKSSFGHIRPIKMSDNYPSRSTIDALRGSYEHELGHWSDPRIGRPKADYDDYRTRKLVYEGVDPDIAPYEARAAKEEDLFWYLKGIKDELRQRGTNGRK